MLATQTRMHCHVHHRFTQHFLLISKRRWDILLAALRKEAEDDLFIDADDLQLELFGNPVLSKEFILKSIEC